MEKVETKMMDDQAVSIVEAKKQLNLLRPQDAFMLTVLKPKDDETNEVRTVGSYKIDMMVATVLQVFEHLEMDAEVVDLLERRMRTKHMELHPETASINEIFKSLFGIDLEAASRERAADGCKCKACTARRAKH